MSATNSFKCTIVSVFAFLLVFPTLNDKFEILYPFNIEIVSENRNKTIKPEGFIIKELWNNNLSYTISMENYYNDNYSVRDLLIRCKNQLDYSLFKISDELYIGTDEYLIYKGVVDIEQIQNERMSKESEDNLYKKFLETKKTLNDQGIELFILVCPQKNSVFPEILPNSGVFRPEATSFDRLINYFKNSKEFEGCFIDTKRILKEASNDTPVYYKTDFHWNPYAAAVISKSLVETISDKIGIDVSWNYDIIPKEIQGFIGGQGRDSLSIFNTYAENEYTVVNNFEEFTSKLENIPQENCVLHYNNISKENVLPPVTLIGNSYSVSYFDNVGFYTHFEESFLFHENTCGEFKKPDSTKIVVLQLIESQIFRYENILDELKWE